MNIRFVQYTHLQYTVAPIYYICFALKRSLSQFDINSYMIKTGSAEAKQTYPHFLSRKSPN